MENKYYTPIIEEFHVEFEYEMWETHSKLYDRTIDDSKWVKKKYDTRSISFDKLSCRLKDTRVKYLDREDIESLGWIYSGTTIDNWYKLVKDCERSLSNFMNRSFRIQHDFRTNQGIVIHAYEYNNFSGSEETLYRGLCKNKSELKKLMQQLNLK